MRQRGQKGVSEALEGALRNLESAARVREAMAFAYWEQVVGPQAAAATEPESVRDGILFVRTKSSVWSQELTFLKQHIISELNRRIGRSAIKDVVFRARGLSRKELAPEEQAAFPTDEELALVRLTTEDQEVVRREIAELTAISDAQMRASLERRITRDRKIRRWRLENGWRQCARCTAVHRDAGDLCPVCRLCR